jgi:hypothetical protein
VGAFITSPLKNNKFLRCAQLKLGTIPSIHQHGMNYCSERLKFPRAAVPWLTLVFCKEMEDRMPAILTNNGRVIQQVIRFDDLPPHILDKVVPVVEIEQLRLDSLESRWGIELDPRIDRLPTVLSRVLDQKHPDWRAPQDKLRRDTITSAAAKIAPVICRKTAFRDFNRRKEQKAKTISFEQWGGVEVFHPEYMASDFQYVELEYAIRQILNSKNVNQCDIEAITYWILSGNQLPEVIKQVWSDDSPHEQMARYEKNRKKWRYIEREVAQNLYSVN